LCVCKTADFLVYLALAINIRQLLSHPPYSGLRFNLFAIPTHSPSPR